MACHAKLVTTLDATLGATSGATPDETSAATLGFSLDAILGAVPLPRVSDLLFEFVILYLKTVIYLCGCHYKNDCSMHICFQCKFRSQLELCPARVPEMGGVLAMAEVQGKLAFGLRHFCV